MRQECQGFSTVQIPSFSISKTLPQSDKVKQQTLRKNKRLAEGKNNSPKTWMADYLFKCHSATAGRHQESYKNNGNGCWSEENYSKAAIRSSV